MRLPLWLCSLTRVLGCHGLALSISGWRLTRKNNTRDVLGPAVVERYIQILKFEASLIPPICYRVGIQYREGINTSMKGRERLQEIMVTLQLGKSRETIQFHYDALVLSMEVRHSPVNC